MHRHNREKDHKISLSVMRRAEEIFWETYDAYKRRAGTNAKIAENLGVSERAVLNANKTPLSTSGWMVLIMMAQLENEKRKEGAFE